MKKDKILAAITIILLTLSVFALFQLTADPPVKISQPKQTKIVELPKSTPLPVASDIETKLNEFRSTQGLPAFSDSAVLDQAAQARAEGMCAENNWSHNGDWAVLEQYYAYSYAGENLYYGSLQDNQAAKAVHDWSLSPEHLKNMVGDYTDIGVGIKLCPGFQNSQNPVIITNYFGVPQ